MNKELTEYISRRSKSYPGAIEGWMVEEMQNAIKEAFDLLHIEIDHDYPYGGAKERVYELMDKILN